MEKEKQYDEIVRRFADPKGEFKAMFRNTMKKYRPSLSEEQIDDLFQDSFIAARRNLVEGRIKENTSWNSYLIAIGLNLASHEFRSFGRFDSLDDGQPAASAAELHRLAPEDVAEYNSVEVQVVFGETLEFMNDSCRKILTLTFYDKLSSEEIAVEMGSTARSIITRRNRCKQNFITLLQARLRELGYNV